tara:strand:+ start:1146 stop:2141 length:996 start_codon:yes stop_codon:yes gene_type:complete
MVNIAINGFGRIGRLILRASIDDPDIEIAAINDLTDPGTLAHLLRYDSVHGKFNGTIEAKKSSIEVNGNDIPVYAKKEPNKLPWKKADVDVVMECTGRFREKNQASLHLKAGAKKILLSAPAKGKQNVKTIVMGVNDNIYKGEKIISNASCTTNCFAPMAKVINDDYTIIDGVMTTVHGYTADQHIVDSPHKDLRRGKAAALNIVPTTTGAAKAIGLVIPKLKGKLIGGAVRVPVADGSLCHFVAEVKKKCTTECVNESFKKISENSMKGILEYSEEALVSSDIIGNPHSCVFDSLLTEFIGNNVVLVGWYDNEWGYSNRMIDVAKLMMEK